MNTTTEQLAEQLRELKLEHPQPGAITARVLAAAARPAPRWRLSRMAIAVAILLAALPGTWGVLYFSPATAAALADASGSGGFSSEILDHFGLGTGSLVTAQNSSATSSGYTVQLVGVYADSIRTVVLFKTTPPAFTSSIMRLTDQFGTEYHMRGGEGNLNTGDQAFEFEPASALTSVTGMRFTLTIDRLTPDQRTIPRPREVSGAWILKGVELPRAGTKLVTPAQGSLGDGTVTFVEARYSGRVVLIRADVRGVSLEGNVGVEGPKNKPVPRFRVELTPVDGGRAAVGGGGWSSSSGSPAHVEALFYSVDPGTYKLNFVLAGAGTLTRTLVVR